MLRRVSGRVLGRASGGGSRLRTLALLAAALGLALLPLPATAATVAFTITDPRITQSTGLARQTSAGRYWTVNGPEAASDPSAPATAYALSPKGAVTGTLTFRAQPIAMEAAATYGDRLYLADIGDPDKSRTFVTVYFFDKAAPHDADVPYMAYDFEYPDGSHDAETLLVDGVGRLYIVTKGAKGAIYAAPGQPSRQALNRLVKAGDAPAWVTDGVFLPGDRAIALRGYLSVTIVDASTYKVVARAPLPAQPRGESMTVSLNGTALLVGSGGTNSPVYSVKPPTSLGKVPKAASVPPQTPAPSPTPSASSDDDDTDEDSGAGNRGTWLAVGLAAVVAIVAGAVVAAVRPRRSARAS